MAYGSTNSDGRVLGSHILYRGQYIPLTQFSQAMGYNDWPSYIQENPVTAGRVQINVSGEKQEAFPDITANEIIRSITRTRVGDASNANDAYYVNSPDWQYDDRTRSWIPTQLGGDRYRGSGRGGGGSTTRREEPSGQGGDPIYRTQPVGGPRDIRGPDGNPVSRMEDFPTIIPDQGGNLEDFPRIIPDNQGGGYRLFSQNAPSSIRTLYAQQTQRDAYAGGNITDIYRTYLGGD